MHYTQTAVKDTQDRSSYGMSTGRHLTGANSLRTVIGAHDDRFLTFAERNHHATVCSGAVDPVITQDDAPTSTTRNPQNLEAEV